MRFGLKENIISDIRHICSSFPAISKVTLYGSRAKGNFKPGSDIDLAIDGEHIDTSLLNKLSLLPDELYLPYTFDLSILSRIDNADLLEHINRVGVVLYKK